MINPFLLRDFFRKQVAQPVGVPRGVRIYAIGDIHGRRDLLEKATALIESHIRCSVQAQSTVVLLGDYIDRGPDSHGVLEHIIGGFMPGEVVALRGNHEKMLLDFIEDESLLENWRQYGAMETLQSYGVPVVDVMRGRGYAKARNLLQEKISLTHETFLRSTRLSFSVGDYFFCHAGVRPNVPLDQQREDDLLWIREEFLSSKTNFGKVVVHGHTPNPMPDVRSNRINIDTGAYATSVLTVLVLEGTTHDFLSTI